MDAALANLLNKESNHVFVGKKVYSSLNDEQHLFFPNVFFPKFFVADVTKCKTYLDF